MYTPEDTRGEKQPSVVHNRQKANGQVRQREDDVNIIVNKTKTKPKISPDSSVGSMDSRAQSECGSIRSSDKEIYPGPIQQGHTIVSIELFMENYFNLLLQFQFVATGMSKQEENVLLDIIEK